MKTQDEEVNNNYEVYKFLISRLLRCDFSLETLSPCDRKILEQYEREYPAIFIDAYNYALEYSTELKCSEKEEEEASSERAFQLKENPHSDEDRVDISTKSVKEVLGIEADELHIADIRGDSMNNIGLKTGDMAIYKQLKEIPKNDTIVIAKIAGEHFIKKLKYINNTVYLLSENPKYPPFNLEESRSAKVVGEVIANITFFDKD